MKNTLSILFTFTVLMACASTPREDPGNKATKHKKTNIIFIMADDLGYETIGANGGTSYQTPYIDKMAQEGIRFTNAHSQPLCSPTRVQIMTGKYNYHNYKAFGIMDSTEVTFAHLLKDAGYVTGISGKWQLLGNDMQQRLAEQRGAYPQEMGFDKYFVWHVETKNLDSRYKDPVIYTEEGNKTFTDKYGPDMFLEWSKDFINENKDSTFFLYYPMVLVHDPFQITPKNGQFANSKSNDKSNTEYFGEMVNYMDYIVGEVIKTVKEAGISENTLIVFTGDNGTSVEVVSDWNGQQVRGDKGSSRTWGTHVPMIAYWEGNIKANQLSDNLIDFSDVLPTLMDVAEEDIPKNFHTDGISFYNQLLSKENTNKRESIFGYYYPKWGRFINAEWVQDGKWKLYESGEFFDLTNDSGEENPLQDQSLNEEAKLAKQKLQGELKKYHHQ